MSIVKFALKAALGVALVAVGAEKIGATVCDVKEDIKAKKKAKENNESTETEE